MLRYRCSLLFFVTESVKESEHHIPFLQIIRFHHSKSEKENVLERLESGEKNIPIHTRISTSIRPTCLLLSTKLAIYFLCINKDEKNKIPNAVSLRYRCSLFLILRKGEKSNILPLNGKNTIFITASIGRKKDRNRMKNFDNIPKKRARARPYKCW